MVGQALFSQAEVSIKGGAFIAGVESVVRVLFRPGKVTVWASLIRMLFFQQLFGGWCEGGLQVAGAGW